MEHFGRWCHCVIHKTANQILILAPIIPRCAKDLGIVECSNRFWVVEWLLLDYYFGSCETNDIIAISADGRNELYVISRDTMSDTPSIRGASAVPYSFLSTLRHPSRRYLSFTIFYYFHYSVAIVSPILAFRFVMRWYGRKNVDFFSPWRDYFVR